MAAGFGGRVSRQSLVLPGMGVQDPQTARSGPRRAWNLTRVPADASTRGTDGIEAKGQIHGDWYSVRALRGGEPPQEPLARGAVQGSARGICPCNNHPAPDQWRAG